MSKKIIPFGFFFMVLSAFALVGCEDNQSEVDITTNPQFLNHWQDTTTKEKLSTAANAADQCEGLTVITEEKTNAKGIDLGVIFIARDGQVRKLMALTAEHFQPRYKELGFVNKDGVMIYSQPYFNEAYTKAKTEFKDAKEGPSIELKAQASFEDENTLHISTNTDVKVDGKVTAKAEETYFNRLDTDSYNALVARAQNCLN